MPFCRREDGALLVRSPTWQLLHSHSLLQKESWRSLLSGQAQLHRLWATPHSSTSLALLARFEAKQYIHVTSSSSDASLPKHTLQFHLPRFRLQFVLNHDSHSLTSQQYAGYHIPPSPDELPQGNPALPPGLQEFLILRHSDPGIPDRVLVPDGTISGAPKSSRISVAVPAAAGSADAELQHHAYVRNGHTGHLDTEVLQSRLFLAALHAAADLRVPLHGLGMAGGEHALQLVRRCHVSRPLTVREAATLHSVRAFSAHTPALTLACAAMLHASQELAFLHGAGRADASAAVRPEEILLYQQEASRAAEAGCINPRRVLTAAEAAQFACVPPRQLRQTAVVPWDEVGECMDERSRRIVKKAAGRSFQTRLEQIASRHLREAAPVPTEHLECMQPGLRRLQGSVHGREVAQVLEESLQAYLASPAPCNMAGVNLLQLRSELEILAEDVGDAVGVMKEWLLGALAYSGSSVEGAVLSAMRCCGAAATPAPEDLIQATISPGLVQVEFQLKLLPTAVQKSVLAMMPLWLPAGSQAMPLPNFGAPGYPRAGGSTQEDALLLATAAP